MTKKAETIHGVPVTEDMIQDWAAEADAGYAPEQLHPAKRGRPTLGSKPAVQVSVRLEAELLDLVAENAERRHVNRSDVIREAVWQYLHAS